MPTGHRMRAAPKRFLLRARNCYGMSRAMRSKEQTQAGGGVTHSSQIEIWPAANLVNSLNDILALMKTVSGRISMIVFSALGYWSGSHFVILMGKA